MTGCSGNHPSGSIFAAKESLHVSLRLGPRNEGRQQHVATVVLEHVTRQCLRNGRVPLLDTLEVSFLEDAPRGPFVYASCDAVVLDGSAACVARSIESERINTIIGRRRASVAAALAHQGRMN